MCGSTQALRPQAVRGVRAEGCDDAEAPAEAGRAVVVPAQAGNGSGVVEVAAEGSGDGPATGSGTGPGLLVGEVDVTVVTGGAGACIAVNVRALPCVRGALRAFCRVSPYFQRDCAAVFDDGFCRQQHRSHCPP